MQKQAHRTIGGPSCAIDQSCCGKTEVVAGDEPACALTPSETTERAARWNALLAMPLDQERTLGSAVFHFDDTAHLRSELQELMALERGCCAQVSWHVSWHLSRRRDGASTGLTLTLKSGEQSLQSILSMVSPPSSAAASERAER